MLLEPNVGTGFISTLSSLEFDRHLNINKNGYHQNYDRLHVNCYHQVSCSKITIFIKLLHNFLRYKLYQIMKIILYKTIFSSTLEC